jgi:hypothetical protein
MKGMKDLKKTTLVPAPSCPSCSSWWTKHSMNQIHSRVLILRLSIQKQSLLGNGDPDSLLNLGLPSPGLMALLWSVKTKF